MRKVLSFVLVLAMILGSVSMAFAFSDTNGKDYEEAADVLNELGVISGYTDGTFGGEKNITRAEFATMIVNALGFTTVGSAVTGFTDVPNDYWAAQAILTAKNLGIVYGKTATTFDPKANITNDEAIAMVVRALGYKAEYLMGTYPTSYVNQAMTLGMLDDVATGSAAATRGNIAQLIYNALGQFMVSYNYFGVVQPLDSATLLTRLGYARVGVGVIWDKLDAKQGLYGDKYYNEATDKYFFIPKSEFVTGKFSSNTIKEADGTKLYTTLSAIRTGFVNGVEETYNNTADKTLTFAISKTANSNGQYTVYSTVEWNGTDYLAPDTIQKEIKDAKIDAGSFDKKADGTIKTNKFFLNGVDALADIKEDDVVTYYVGSDEFIHRVDVASKTVEGKITKWDSDGKLYIDGTAYSMVSALKTANGDPLEKDDALGQTGTAYFNYAGKIAFFGETVSAKKYAVVLGYTTGSAVGAGSLEASTKGTAELLLADGTKVKMSYKNIAEADMASLFLDKVVSYGTKDDVVTTMSAVVGAPATTKVLKNSTIGGHYIATNCVVFVKNDDFKWSVGEVADLLGNSYELAYATEKDTDRVGVIAIDGGATGADETLYVFTGKYAKVDATTPYYELSMFIDGEAQTVNATEDGFEDFTAVGIYTVTLSGSKVNAAEVKNATKPNETYKSYKSDALSVEVVAGTGTAWYSLDKDVVVYVYDKTNDKVTVGSVSDFSKSNAKLSFWDTTDGGDDVYDVVLVEF